jgi:hypothetical protein
MNGIKTSAGDYVGATRSTENALTGLVNSVTNGSKPLRAGVIYISPSESNMEVPEHVIPPFKCNRRGY